MPKKLGGKVQRFTAGGTTFYADRWYKLPLASAQAVEGLTQSRFTTTKMFQVVDEAEYVEINRKELATAMLGSSNADALALLNGLQGLPALGKSAKSKTKKSDFAALQVSEVEQTAGLRAAVVAKTEDPDDEDEDLDEGDEGDDEGKGEDGEPKAPVIDPAKTGQPDIEGLTRKADAVALGASYGLEFDSKTQTLADMKKALTKEIFGDEG